MRQTSKKVMVHIITSLGGGGAEASLFKLLSALDPHEYDRVVICLRGQGVYSDRLSLSGVEVVHLHGSLWNMPLKIRQLYHMLKCKQPDIVQTWMYHADLLGGVCAKLAGVPKIIWGIRDAGSGHLKGATYLVLRLCAALSKMVPDYITTNSERARFNHIKKGYCAKKFVVIANGFDLSQFKEKLPPEAKRSKLVIGMLARYHPDKDYENLLDALFILRQKGIGFEARLAGNQVEKILRQKVEARGLADQVTLLPATSDPAAFFSKLDIFVLSSRTEAFPNVLGEAMAAGIPCVATDVGDAENIVGGAGIIVPPENSPALAEALENMLSLSAAVREELGEKARRRIEENFSLNKMVQQFKALYEGRSCAA